MNTSYRLQMKPENMNEENHILRFWQRAYKKTAVRAEGPEQRQCGYTRVLQKASIRSQPFSMFSMLVA